MTEAEKFIQEEVPPLRRAVLPKALRAAYEAVDLTLGETAYLQIPSAKMAARGYLLPFAVEFALQGLVDKGDWPFSYEYEFNRRPTGRHLAIVTPNAVMTVSQLQAGEAQPRWAGYRENYGLSNQTLFRFESERLKKKFGDMKKHLILGHGYQDLTFVQIGVPNPDGEGYIATSRNILEEIQDATPDLASVEEVSSKDIVTLKEKLQRKLKDDGS